MPLILHTIMWYSSCPLTGSDKTFLIDPNGILSVLSVHDRERERVL